MVGAHGYVAAHADNRIAVGRTVLDLQAFYRIGIVAGPCLGRVIEHTRVKPCPAACAGLKENLRKCTGQAFIKVINTQNIAVEHFSLLICRESSAPAFADAAVHIPFDIRDFCMGQDLCHHFVNAVYHLRAGKVQDILEAAVGDGAVRRLQDPVRVGAVQIGILIHHLWFKPEPEFQAKGCDFFGDSGDAFR